MKRISRLPVLAGGIVMAAVLASLALTTSGRVYAQVTVYRYQYGGYYNPYGQGPYSGYGRSYAVPGRANGLMFPSHGRMFVGPANGLMFPSHGGMYGGRAYGYSGYGNVPSGYGYGYDYGIGPQIRVYGRSTYYQPYYGRVYVPFGY